MIRSPFSTDATTPVVRYYVVDIGRAVTFYTEYLGFHLDQRAGAVFASLLTGAQIDPASVRVAAISGAAGAGPWRTIRIAEQPDDSALLAAAARLCEKD